MLDTLDPGLSLLLNLRDFYASAGDYYETVFHTHVELITKDLNLAQIAAEPSSPRFLPLLELVLAMAVKCSNKQTYISRMWSLPAGAQEQLMVFIQAVLDKFDRPEGTLQDVVKAFKGDKRMLWADFETMKSELLRTTRKLENAIMEKNSLKASLNELESDLRNRSGSRSSTEIESFIRLEYENQLLAKNDQISDLQQELIKSEAKFFSEIRRLKDELDIQSERIQQLNSLESSLETYKKRLEEQAGLKRQIKELGNAKAELQEKLKKTDEIETHLGQLQRSAELLKEQLKLEKEKNANLHFRLSEMDTKLQIAENTAREYQERSVILEGKLKAQISEEYAGWEAGRSSGESASLQRDFVADYEEKIRRLMRENEAIREAVDSKALIDHYNSELDTVLLSKKKAEEQLSRALSHSELLEKTILDANSRFSALQIEFNQISAEKTNIEEKLQTALAEIAKNRAIQQDLIELKTQLARNEEILRAERGAKEDLKTQLLASQQMISALETQIIAMKSKIGHLEVKLKEKSDAEELLVKEIESFKSYQPEMTQLQGQNIKLIELERELTHLRGENSSLSLNLVDKDQELQSLSSDYQRIIGDLQRQMSELKGTQETQLVGLQTQLKSLASELFIVKSQQREMTEEWMREQRLVSMIIHSVGLEMCQERFRARVKA